MTNILLKMKVNVSIWKLKKFTKDELEMK